MYDGRKEPFGRLCGKKPKQAANKAFTTILKHLSTSNIPYTSGQKINFSIKECTRGSKCSEYNYEGHRILLDKPLEVNINAKEKNKETGVETLVVKPVTYRNKNVVKKVPKNLLRFPAADQEQAVVA